MSEAVIKTNKNVAGEYYIMSLSWQAAGEAAPGQFVMLRVTDPSSSTDPILRRPFSIARAKDGVIELLYKVVGRGTKAMAALKKGTALDVMGPLGRGFPDAEKTLSIDSKNLIMVAGGIGLAPFHMVVDAVAKEKRKNLRLFYGARGAEDAGLCRVISKSGIKVHVATEDGSVGEKGFVTNILKKEIYDENSVVYACGPTGMLKAVAALALEAGARCYVSLESAMACGIGVCLGCAVSAAPGCSHDGKKYKMVCSDGPVFEAREIDWERV